MLCDWEKKLAMINLSEISFLFLSKSQKEIDSPLQGAQWAANKMWDFPPKNVGF